MPKKKSVKNKPLKKVSKRRKTTKKKSTHRKKRVPSIKRRASEVRRISKSETDRLLIENFVTLQKVLTNLSIKFDSLTDQISKLLGLFEISAKSFAEKQGTSITTEDREFLDKLDQLMEQNKLIAKGLTIISEQNVPPRQPAPTQYQNQPPMGMAGRPLKRLPRR